MRLEKIKLAGFKSFVDPTVVLLPSNLVAVVGPNGCGKSNVIDAVRWVMGESSAKMLRGESMADVIFNGSSSRKPVGNAIIELVFDNQDGAAGGQFARFNQISVKRQVSRDGQSAYFLNGARCRRRDITDLFLGTGLGPRSYSIIEQGMISRLIEARPEDLRLFLEEAAGISKYKERRRETETRIRNTRENLDRLNDLREEVGKHLQHLERQAATAERYKSLRAEERRLKAELLALRWRTLDADLAVRERLIAGLETRVEGALARQRRLEAEIEEDRERQHEAGERFNEVQGRFYAAGADIARLEQALQFHRESVGRQRRELAQVEAALGQAAGQLAQDEARLGELEQTLSEREPALERLEAEADARAGLLDSAEDALHAWQSEWDAFNRGAAAPAQTAQVERTRINHLEQQTVQAERRLHRLTEELTRLDNPRLEQELAELEGREQGMDDEVVQRQDQLHDAGSRIQTLRGGQADLLRRLDEAKRTVQAAVGRRGSLETLQQAALGGEGEALKTWLAAESLTGAPRLADALEADGPWQRATELVLGQSLQARCTESLDTHGAALDGLPDGPLSLFETAAVAAAPIPGDGLLARVRCPWPLAGLLGGVRTADSLGDALARRRDLGPGESLVTPEGGWVGRDWLRIPGRDEAGAGVLERTRELRELARRIATLEGQAGEIAGRLEAEREALEQAEQERDEAQHGLDQANRELARVRSELAGKRTRLEHLLHRREAVESERAEVQAQITLDREAAAEARVRLHAALEEMETLAGRRESLVARRDGLRTAQDEARAAARSARDQSHRLALEVGSARTARDSLVQGLERLRLQVAQLDERRTELTAGLDASGAPLDALERDLERALEVRLDVEQALGRARGDMEAVDAALREREQGRVLAEQEVLAQRGALDRARLERQEVLVRSRTLEEQLKEADFQAPDLLALLPPEAAEERWQEEVERVGARIQRLGPINLAAIDEFREESERKRYLDEQYGDITRSLETLEEAIRKIDRETRSRFKDTFDQVNLGLQALFPRLFGGGHAYLDLTGEDLLDTGVAVMARPPGKRNSSIHMLSGGEKALTAVALVFSIFQLNPAPFCMLDEVDAPLDDANVGRFCELVKSMSDKVQFIFITHNKVTMELANQLTGVTMHEPGVSRLVSVDVDEAVQMAVG